MPTGREVCQKRSRDRGISCSFIVPPLHHTHTYRKALWSNVAKREGVLLLGQPVTQAVGNKEATQRESAVQKANVRLSMTGWRRVEALLMMLNSSTESLTFRHYDWSQCEKQFWSAQESLVHLKHSIRAWQRHIKQTFWGWRVLCWFEMHSHSATAFTLNGHYLWL